LLDAPWCAHCKELAPEYAKAAKTLKDEGSTIRLAKVDAVEEKELAERFEVKSYPILKFFRDGVPVSTNFGNKAEDIVSWLKKKTGLAAEEVTTAAEVKILTDKHYVVVLGLFKV